jgi:hypothetical protein
VRTGGTGNTPPVSPPQGNPGGEALLVDQLNVAAGGGGGGAGAEDGKSKSQQEEQVEQEHHVTVQYLEQRFYGPIQEFMQVEVEVVVVVVNCRTFRRNWRRWSRSKMETR